MRIQPALTYIASCFTEEISVGTLAAQCHMSIPNLRKLFYRATGVAPIVYINHFRLKAAGVLLRNTDRTVLDIALSSGFKTLSNFNRQFRMFYGVTPSEWRKN